MNSIEEREKTKLRSHLETFLLCLVVLSVMAIVQLAITRAARNDTSEQPLYTADDIEDYVSELTPLVEKVTGRYFRKHPKIEVVNRHELFTVLISESELWLPDIQNIEVVRHECDRMASTYVGKYGYLTNTLYMIPENLEFIERCENANFENIRALVKLFIAHELAHALANQEACFPRLLKQAETVDEMDSINSVIEGHAMLVEEQIANQLGYQDLFKWHLDQLSVTHTHSADSQEPQPYAKTDIYLSGLKFMKMRFDAGGNDRIWSILSSPPKNTRVICHPDRDIAASEPPLDLKSIFQKTIDQVDIDKSQVRNCSLVEMELLRKLKGLDLFERSQIAEGFRQAQVLTKGSFKHGFQISVFVMRDHAAAQNLASSISKLVVSDLKASPRTKKVTERAISSVRTSEQPAKAISAIITTDGRQYDLPAYFFVRDRSLVQIGLSDIKLSDEKVTDLADEIFRSLAKLHPTLP